jgi:3-oxoadipate enol-lactonase
MPMHGNSKLVNEFWDMNSCVDMFFEILDELGVDRVIAIGHSWGSMTILRAANINPNRFEKLILFNMPYKASTIASRLLIRLRHLMLVFPQFYYEQAGKSLMSKESLKKNKFLIKNFIQMMNRLKSDEIVKTDKEVLVNAVNTLQLINDLSIPHVIVKGKDDYVPLPPNGKTMIIPGGHLSPMEVPDEVTQIIKFNL